jgi:hypothetical protein
MSDRKLIRQGIATYFGGATFDAAHQIYRPTPLAAAGLGGVRTFMPVIVTGEDRMIGLTAGSSMGAVMGVWLGESAEKRLTIGGTLDRPYAVHLMIWHLSMGPITEDAQSHIDDLVEAIVARIRADPTLGMGPDSSGPKVTQAGEGERGITTSPGWPATEPGSSPRTLQDAAISFQVNTYPNIA